MKNSRETIMERQNKVLLYLKKNTYASVAEISEAMNVSPATIRRDIVALKKSGEVQKEFSGTSVGLKILPSFDDERFFLTNIPEKEAIARQAARMLEDSDTVFVNASSTALRIYPYITDKMINVITNNGRSLVAHRNAGTDLIITGGEVSQAEAPGNTKMAMTGGFALDMINRVTANKCILGVSGISVSGGLTSMVVKDPAINKAMIKNCKGNIIIVADSRKIGIEHNFRFAEISEVSCLITDSKADPEEIARLRDTGLRVVIVEPLEKDKIKNSINIDMEEKL